MAATQRPRQVVLLLGGPGAGKSTQARLLSTALHLPHISAGDLLRDRARKATLARMARGDLLTDDMVNEIVLERLGGSILGAVYVDAPSDELIQRPEQRGLLS